MKDEIVMKEIIDKKKVGIKKVMKVIEMVKEGDEEDWIEIGKEDVKENNKDRNEKNLKMERNKGIVKGKNDVGNIVEKIIEKVWMKEKKGKEGNKIEIERSEKVRIIEKKGRDKINYVFEIIGIKEDEGKKVRRNERIGNIGESLEIIDDKVERI